jgi:hypothetical protein
MLQICQLVLVPFEQLPIPLELGGLGVVSAAGPGPPTSEIHQGGAAQGSAPGLPRAHPQNRARVVRIADSRKAGILLQVRRQPM